MIRVAYDESATAGCVDLRREVTVSVKAEVAGIARDRRKVLDELESLVQRLEQGELSLDESLATFERGIALYRGCQSALEQAEQRVKLLMDPADPASARPFEPDTP
jgi:exodeoxyribonuclease VII small subunit